MSSIEVKRSYGAVIQELEERIETETLLLPHEHTIKGRQIRNAGIRAYEISLSIVKTLYTEEMQINGQSMVFLPWDSDRDLST